MIFRRTLQSKFTAISNAICLDETVSTDARWCLWYLLTKPVDWEVRVNDIRRVSGWGKDKTYKVVNELVGAKYLVVSQTRDQDGQFGSVNYDVYDEPFNGSPLAENPEADCPVTVNQEHTKDLRKQNTEKKPNTESNISFDSDFEEFWAAYPRRPNNPRKKALAAYKKARKNVSQKQLLTAVNEYATYMAGEDSKFVAMASTWLNDERWNCDYSRGAKVIDAYKAAKTPSGLSEVVVEARDLKKIADLYPGLEIGADDPLKALARELNNGATVEKIKEAADKYRLLIKSQREQGLVFPLPSLGSWLRFKWRDMDAYEFCRLGMNNTLSVRPKRKG